MLTPHQAKYIAYELTKRSPSESPEKLSVALFDAQVDLNPHQVEAALFAFNSPLSKGAVLADEVGLGKTIEAGILLSQRWAEGKRKLLVICPSNLRKQWQQELSEKFYLPSVILETKAFNKALKNGKANPFDCSKIVICSYHFIRNKESYVQLSSWDMAVIDEAHRLRNVYKPSNKIGSSIKQALEEVPKVLLTATPLQNSLMELYGLVSIIDDQVFGDKKSFRSQFVRAVDGSDNYEDLKDRLSPICKRNLRRQVQEYISYTNRIPITIQFEPTTEEQVLYDLVTEYLQRDLLLALPKSQRHLMTLIMRKLLASSSYAISGTLDGLAKKLKKVRDQKHQMKYYLADDDITSIDIIEELQDEWNENGEFPEEEFIISEEDRENFNKEIKELESFRDLAQSIEHNVKGDKLLHALDMAFRKADELGSPDKAIIFTESTRTQKYLFDLLENSPYKGKSVLFNGSNNDERSKGIYRQWVDRYNGTERVSGNKTVDIRAAITDYFRDDASILIATEAAAEGINLQFCSTIINYDLPWNPQRIEQRIGRCHRYGQKYDVVVVNFVNVKNAADRRVYELLDEKFKLFSGVFGASDEVLGAIESGVDFERRIVDIYQKCRSEAEIQASFDVLQIELEEQIHTKLQTTRQKLLEHFDIEVVEKLKVTLNESREYLTRYQQWMWDLMNYALGDYAVFNEADSSFVLSKNPYKRGKIPTGRYKIASKVDDAYKLRINHPLTKEVISAVKNHDLEPICLSFDLSGYEGQIRQLEPYIGHSGWLRLDNIAVESIETSDYLLFTLLTDEGESLNESICKRLLSLPVLKSERVESGNYPLKQLQTTHEKNYQMLLQAISQRNRQYFLKEAEKLNKWADDRIFAAEQAIRDTKDHVKELNRLSRDVTDTDKLLEIQRKLREVNKKQRRQRQQIFDVEDHIEQQRDSMIHDIEQRLKQNIHKTSVFTLRWNLT